MTTLRFDIPVDKIPVLATAAILAGQDLGSWAAGETRDRIMASAQEIPDPVETDLPVVLDSLPETQPEPAAVPDSDFFADII